MPFFFPQQQSLAQEQEMDLFQLLSILSALEDEPSTATTQTKPQPKPQAQPQQPYHYVRRHAPRPTPTFTPAFDILETGASYELFGEVPGLDINTLEVRFEDAQTLVLKGQTARAKPTPTPTPTPVVEEKKEEVVAKEDVKGKQHATVEDSTDEEYDSVDTPLTTATTPSTATAAEIAAPAVKVQEKKPEQQATRAKYWLTERRTGQFARSFTFAQRIEIDDVTAELKEGVLHVVVPKSVKSKKVQVHVV